MAYGNGFCVRKILRKSDNQSLNDLEVLFLDTGFGSQWWIYFGFLVKWDTEDTPSLIFLFCSFFLSRGSSCAMSSILLFDTDLQSIEYIHSLVNFCLPRQSCTSLLGDFSVGFVLVIIVCLVLHNHLRIEDFPRNAKAKH